MDSSYNLWHFGRPISGAIAGLMTVVLLQIVNKGGADGAASGGALSEPVVYATAFIFGTQERRFFNFLYEIAKLIVQVPQDSKSTTLRLTGIQPAEGSAGGVVVISGQGIESTASIKLGGAPIEKLAVASDGTSAAGLIPARPIGADTVDVVATNATGASFVLDKKFKFVA